MTLDIHPVAHGFKAAISVYCATSTEISVYEVE